MLPLPRNGKIYEYEEIADFIIDYGRRYVINAIADARCYQSQPALQSLFPQCIGMKNIYNDEATFRRILGLYQNGSVEQTERARLMLMIINADPFVVGVVDDDIPPTNAICGAHSDASIDGPQPLSIDDTTSNRVSPDIFRGVPEADDTLVSAEPREDDDDHRMETDTDSLTVDCYVDQTHRPTKPDRKRLPIEVSSILAPAFMKYRECDEYSEWDPTGKSVCRKVACSDADDLQCVLYCISRSNPKRAADAITRFLNKESNKVVADDVISSFDGSDLNSQIIKGLRQSIAHHTNSKGGTRTMASETFVKNVALSACFSIVQDGLNVSNTSLAKTIGTTREQIDHALKTANKLITDDTKITPIQRVDRYDKIADKIDPFIYDFICDNEISRLDTKQHFCEIDDPKSPGNKIRVHKRIWEVGNCEQQYKRFKESDQYQDLQRALGNDATVGMTLFRKVKNKLASGFITAAKQDSCVDPITSGLEHSMRAVLNVLLDKHVKSLLGGHVAQPGELSYDQIVDILKAAGYVNLVESICCNKVDQPDLCHEKGNKEKCPNLIPFKCTHGTSWKGEHKCNQCGMSKRLRLLDVLVQDLPPEVSENQVDVLVWKDVPRQGKTKDGKQNMQKELTEVSMNIPDLIKDFQQKLELCIPHHADVRWYKLMWDIQLSTLQDGVLHIATDFAATLNLRAGETLNCSTDAHAVVCNFVCTHHRRKVKVVKTNKQGEEISEEITVYTVDVHHSMADTSSSGKKNDHVMHNATLEAIIEHYKCKFIEIDPTKPLKHVIVHTDNCPTQYRCRHTILRTAMAMKRTGVKISHCYTVVSNFKGVHDAVGKDVTSFLTKLKLGKANSDTAEGMTRTPTAFRGFENCIFHGLDRPEQNEHWKTFEVTHDFRLKAKGTFAIDSRRFWFAVESVEEQERLSLAYPGRIILCDRTHVIDTHTHRIAFPSTVNLHQVNTVDAGHLDNRYMVNLLDRYCICKECRIDPKSKACKFVDYKHQRDVVMISNEIRDESPTLVAESNACSVVPA